MKLGEFLDSNLKVKNHENLYVCDCSAIPEPWGLPPGLTLVCLGKRLAAHGGGKDGFIGQESGEAGKAEGEDETKGEGETREEEKGGAR